MPMIESRCGVIFIFGLLIAIAPLSLGAPPEKPTGPPVELPTFVVIGFRIPTSWLEVSWECRGPLPYNRIKRAWISKVGHGTPAEKAGFKVGDTLLAIGGQALESMSGVTLEENLKLERDPGTRLEFVIQTKGSEKRSVAILFEAAPR